MRINRLHASKLTKPPIKSNEKFKQAIEPNCFTPRETDRVRSRHDRTHGYKVTYRIDPLDLYYRGETIGNSARNEAIAACSSWNDLSQVCAAVSATTIDDRRGAFPIPRGIGRRCDQFLMMHRSTGLSRNFHGPERTNEHAPTSP